MHTVRAIVAQPLRKLPGVGGSRGALPDARPNFFNLDRQGIPRLGPLDPDRAGLRIAAWHFGLVPPVGVGADLAREGILRLHQHRLARLDLQARVIVATEFVVEWAKG